MPTLRLYQLDGLNKLRESIKAGNRRILLQSPTGSGKGVMISSILRSAYEKQRKSLFIVHKREIINQVSAHLDVPHGVIMAGENPSPMHLIQLASKDTLVRRNPDLLTPDLVIIDEAHRATAKQYERLINGFPNALVIGFTATPARQSGKGLGEFFQDLIQLTTVKELTMQGFLAPAIYIAPPQIDMQKLKVAAGDYTQASLGEAVQPILGDIFDTFIEYAPDRQAVIFVPRVNNAVSLAKTFNEAGIAADVIDGKTSVERRAEIAKGMRDGSLKVVVNVGVYVEGVDIPTVSCVILATATKSLVKYLQMVGRGLRPGKDDCLVIDHGCNVYQHGMYDSDFEWSLDKGGSHPEPSKREKAEPKEKQDRVCEHCWAIFKYGNVCPVCHKPTTKASKPMRVIQTKMGFIKKPKKPTPAEIKLSRQAMWYKCLYMAKNKGLKVGAAAHMYRQNTGKWPRGVEKLPKGDEWGLSARDFIAKRG